MRFALLAVAAALAVAAPAAAQEDDGIRFPVDPGENAKIRITELDSLNVVLTPADLGLYRSLFSNPLKPNEASPLISFKIHSVAGTMEAWVELRATWCGREGWFNNATAVDNPALYGVSRATGYPKIISEKITLAEQPDGTVVGTVMQLGRELLRLRWRPAATTGETEDGTPITEIDEAVAAEPWRERWLAGRGESYRGKSWSFEPVGGPGPFVKEIQTDEVEGATHVWNSRAGMVEVTVDQGANPLLTDGDWMGLVPVTTEVPGMLERYEGAADFYGRSLQCGLSGSTRELAPSPAKKAKKNRRKKAARRKAARR